MNLKMISIEKPMILNGKRMSHNNGNKKMRAMATGQHNTNKIHQRISVNKVFILEEFIGIQSNVEPKIKTDFLKDKSVVVESDIS